MVAILHKVSRRVSERKSPKLRSAFVWFGLIADPPVGMVARNYRSISVSQRSTPLHFTLYFGWVRFALCLLSFRGWSAAASRQGWSEP